MHRIFGMTVYERLDRFFPQGQEETVICGFTYRVEFDKVFRRSPDGYECEVLSSQEISESLSRSQLAELRKNRREKIKLHLVSC